jgi:hypothetical protein
MNLFQVAQDNGEELSRRYEAMRAAVDAAALSRLDRFVEVVQHDGRLSVNLRAKALHDFLLPGGGYSNVYERAEYLEGRSGQPREELVRGLEHDYYDRRMAFDRFLNQSEQLHYAAFNLGTLGDTLFGDYCLVFQESFATELAELAYLWGNSLETYLLPDCVVNEAALRRDACPHSHRHCQAALKHGEKAVGLAEKSWPALVCSRSDFIEAIFLGHPTPENLQAVRMEQDFFNLYPLLLVDAALGRLSDFDRHLVDDFDTILILLEHHSIPPEPMAA